MRSRPCLSLPCPRRAALLLLLGGLLSTTPAARAARKLRSSDTASQPTVPLVASSVQRPSRDERRVFFLLQRERERRHLPLLRWDDRLAAAARAHSRQMRAHGALSHHFAEGDGAGPLDRVHRAGSSPALLLENVGMAYSPWQANHALMNSLGHRRNMLSTEAERVGVGVAVERLPGGARRLWVTEDFARAQVVFGPESMSRFRARLVALRAHASAGRLDEDAALSTIAARVASEIVAGTLSRAGAGGRVRQELTVAALSEEAQREPQGAPLAVHVITLQMTAPEVWEAPDALLDPSIARYGLAVVPASAAMEKAGALFVVLLLAPR